METVMASRSPLALVEEVTVAEAIREAAAVEALSEHSHFLEEAVVEAPGPMELSLKAEQHRGLTLSSAHCLTEVRFYLPEATEEMVEAEAEAESSNCLSQMELTDRLRAEAMAAAAVVALAPVLTTPLIQFKVAREDLAAVVVAAESTNLDPHLRRAAILLAAAAVRVLDPLTAPLPQVDRI